MKLITGAGLVLIILGAFLLIRGGSFTTKRDVVSVGGLQIKAEEQHPVSPWIAGVIFVAGVGLLVTGARRRA